MSYETVSKEEVQDMMGNDDVEVVYVLKEKQYKHQHIKGSRNIPLDVLKEKAWKQMDKDKKYVVYCFNYDCQASVKAARFLDEKGFEVYDYEGGIEEWAKEGLPTQGSLSREEFLEHAS